MANKIIIGILVFLVIILGGSGYYSYTLAQQVDYLSEQLTVYQQEQARRISAVSSELADLRRETLVRFDSLGDEIRETVIEIGTLKDELKSEIGNTTARIDILEGEIDSTLGRIATLEDEIGDISAALPKSVMNASEVYQKVSQATVRVSNGETLIGSGFIFDTDSHVITAHHVIENMSTIYVVLPDGRLSKASVVGSCERSDVAVLTLRDRLVVEPLTLADSALVSIGEPVATIGNPFDMTETLTTGVVSHTGRYINVDYESGTRAVANLIQFDAPANPGNSGCPLVNSAGDVIGLVIARILAERGDGINYAVSSNKVSRVAAALIAHGSYDYPRLGLLITNLTPQMAEMRGLETTSGALVVEVSPDSPAEVAGVKVDDIVISMDGVNIRDVAGAISYLGGHKSPGDIAILGLIRGDARLELSLTVGKLT